MTQTIKPIPARARPFNKAQVSTPKWLRALVGRDLSPTEGEYQAVTSALWDGDSQMDQLVEWMFANNPKQAKAQFHSALANGVERTESCPEPIKDFFRSLETPPAWIDHALIEEGVHFIHGVGGTAGYVLRDLALMGGYLLSGFNQSLVLTGALNKGASQRIAETGKWWIDCTEPHGLKRFGPGFKSTIQVRMIHALVRRNLAARDEWDSQHWGIPLSQIDMAATYLGFSVVMLVGLRKLGFAILPRESKAVMHLWAYACWLMGVEEKWLVQSESEGFVLLNHTYMTQSKPDATSQELAKALSQEPLERSFPHFQNARRQLAFHNHLSMSRYFLGNKGMQQLGFADKGVPWFPILSAAPRAANYAAWHFVPGMRATQQRRGRKAQIDMLASMFGDQEHSVIKPDSNHPAHV